MIKPIIICSIIFIIIGLIFLKLYNSISLKKQSNLNEKIYFTNKYKFQYRLFLLALGAFFNKYKSNKENGDISEDTYDKEALYCILYNSYRIFGQVKHTDNTLYEFTFNTWGFYLPNTNIDENDPQKIGKITYSNHLNNSFVQDYIKKNGRVKIIELGCGTGAGGNLISNLIDCEYTAVDMQKAAIETCKRLFIPNNNNLKCIESNILDLKLDENSFDFVIINETHISEMEYLTEEDKNVFDIVFKILKKDGLLLWGNCIIDKLWDTCINYIESKDMKLLKNTDYTKEALLARDMDYDRVELYISQIMDKITITKIPVIGNKFKTDVGLMLKNFYRHPGTNMYNTMKKDGRDSYKQLVFQKN
tara:strand:- start:2668 stop:3753 length:1086 start_codon:yes stop_codon:yes gene_type:complete